MTATQILVSLGALALGALGLFRVWRRVHADGLNQWIGAYIHTRGQRRAPGLDRPVHVLLCVVDHYEPCNGHVDPATALKRVDAWTQQYPERFARFRDSDGRAPKHSFFYPMEVYNSEHIDRIAELCRAGYGEVEIHLHHDCDTSENLRLRLKEYKKLLSEQHGLLSCHRGTGELAFAFIHGNWALDNSRHDGRWCGVNDELGILREAGCYADFTFPSAPSSTQTRKINSVYYAVDNPNKPRSHDNGVDVGSASRPDDALMLIQGPLGFNWRSRKFGLIPRVENACLQGNQPPSSQRLDLWLLANVHISTRPDWVFIKLHTHGAPEANQRVLLGEPMVRFHEELARRAVANPNFHFHYVSAREMYNLARAAEAGWKGSVNDARDYELVWNGADSRPDTCDHFSMAAR